MSIIYPNSCLVLRLNQSKKTTVKKLCLFFLLIYLFCSLFLSHLNINIFTSFFLNSYVYRLIHSFHLLFFNTSLCEFSVLTFYFRLFFFKITDTLGIQNLIIKVFTKRSSLIALFSKNITN